MDEKQYIRLFNYGYFLSKNEPEILEKFKDASKETAWISEPLKAGEAQYNIEQLKSRMNDLSFPSYEETSREEGKGIEPDI